MAQIPDSPTAPITLTAYAKHRGVSVMTISRAVKRGRLARCVVRDEYGSPKIADVALADREWAENSDYTDAPHRLAAQRPPPAAGDLEAPTDDAPAGGSLADHSARLKRWHADLAELKFRKAAGDLIPAGDVERRLVDVFTACKAKLLALPSRAKQALPHLSHADLEALEALVREALEELVTAPKVDVAPPAELEDLDE